MLQELLRFALYDYPEAPPATSGPILRDSDMDTNVFDDFSGT
jgi:hypothetical protein